MRDFVVTRSFDAPRDLVWKSWTEPERMAMWWGPKGFEWVGCTLDLRPGGMCHYHLRSPGGADMWGKLVYREVAAPHRLVFVVSFSDASGGTTRHPLSETWPLEVLNTVEFREEGGRTTLVLTGRPVNASDAERRTFDEGHAGMRGGFKGSLDQLEHYLGEAPREIVSSRVVAAPRDLVFAAFLDREHIGEWWGPIGFRTTTHHMEVRPGGEWRYTMHGPDGTDYPNRTIYREIVAPSLLRYSHDGGDGTEKHRFESTVMFEEVDAGTRVTLRALFQTVAAREDAAGFGAVEGGRQTLQRLGDFIGRMR